jgi:hypothetical protein
MELLDLAREQGPVHLRTSLRTGEEGLDRLIRSLPDVVSVDLVANSAGTYERLTGHGDYERVVANMTRLLEARVTPDASDAIPASWIVARITRRDDVYEEIEPFFDHWIMTAGACVIDPLPSPIEGERIAPLPLPRLLARCRSRAELTIHPSGAVAIESSATVEPRVPIRVDAHLVGAP